MKKKKLLGSVLAVIILLLASFFGLDVDIPEAAEPVNPGEYVQEVAKDNLQLDPDGSYTSKEDVALYIHTFGCLPSNFITKEEALELAGKAAVWMTMPTANALAATGSVIMRVCFPMKAVGNGRNVTLIPCIKTAGGPNASSFPMTV